MHGRTIDSALLEQATQFDEPARRELRDAIDESFPEHVSPHVFALLTERLAEADANPDDYITLDEFKRRIADRRALNVPHSHPPDDEPRYSHTLFSQHGRADRERGEGTTWRGARASSPSSRARR